MMKQQWNSGNVRLNLLGFFFFFFVIKQISNLSKSLYCLCFLGLSQLEILEIYIYIYITPQPSFFFFEYSSFLDIWKAPLKKALEPWSPQEQRGYMFYSAWLFSEFEKKSACRQFGFVNQSVKDVTEIARCRVRDGGRERERKTADGNISQLAEAKLPSLSIYEFSNGGCAWASSAAACQSQNQFFCPIEVCVCIYYILVTSINLFFVSSEMFSFGVESHSFPA